jgi:alkylmercury lyase
MTTTSSERLVQDFTSVTAHNPTAAALMRMVGPAIRLLAAGEPATVAEIAHASGMRMEETERTLRVLPDVEWDEDGRVSALGLTTRRTAHAMDFDGRTMYAWCALDTLILAAMLERPVRIRSRDPVSGAPIRVQTDATAVIAVTPPAAVMSWVGETPPEEFNTIRATFCHHIHFFASPETAAGWAADHPGGSVLSVPEASKAARRLAEIFANPARDRSVA